MITSLVDWTRTHCHLNRKASPSHTSCGRSASIAVDLHQHRHQRKCTAHIPRTSAWCPACSCVRLPSSKHRPLHLLRAVCICSKHCHQAPKQPMCNLAACFGILAECENEAWSLWTTYRRWDRRMCDQCQGFFRSLGENLDQELPSAGSHSVVTVVSFRIGKAWSHLQIWYDLRQWSESGVEIRGQSDVEARWWPWRCPSIRLRFRISLWKFASTARIFALPSQMLHGRAWLRAGCGKERSRRSLPLHSGFATWDWYRHLAGGSCPLIPRPLHQSCSAPHPYFRIRRQGK